MLEYICPRTLSVPGSEQFSARARLEKNCELRGIEQIMSKDKYPSIFSPQMEAYIFIVLQIALSFENWGIFIN